MRAQGPNRRTISPILTELYQNSRRAGATYIEVTTSARDDGGCNISVKDNGLGVADAKALAGGPETTWPSRVMTAERPTGVGLTALWAAGFTIISKTRTGPKWRMTVLPDQKPADTVPKAQPGTENGNPEPGTTIHLSSAVCRKDARAEAMKAAEHLQIMTRVDDDPVKIRNLLEGAVYTRDVDNIRIGVYNNEPPTADGDLNLAGRIVSAKLPEIRTQTGNWTARAELLPIPPGGQNDLQVAEPWRGTLARGAATEKLRSEAERTILMAMAAQAAPHTFYTETLARARELNVDLPPSPPQLRRWIPDTESPLGKPDNYALIITLDPSEPAEHQATTALLKRALALNKFEGANAFEPDPEFEGQAWYDSIRQITDVEWMVIVNGAARALTDSGTHLRSATQRPQSLHAVLCDAQNAQAASLATDMAMTWANGFTSLECATLYLTASSTATVATVTKIIQEALFDPNPGRQ